MTFSASFGPLSHVDTLKPEIHDDTLLAHNKRDILVD